MSSSELVALLGADGQLGYDLRKSADQLGIRAIGLGHEDVDVTRADDLTKKFDEIRPAVVINSAAFHQVDRCEEDPTLAFQVNSVGALNVARAAEKVGARCVYISTDYVFDGRKKRPRDGQLDPETGYVESDCTAPLNVYGASKLAGENSTLQTGPKNLVIRVSSLFGIAGARGKGGNFIETILKRAREGEPLKVVDDQWMTPTYAADAAEAILDLALSGVSGIVHVSNQGACTWHTFATAAVRGAGMIVPVEPVPAATYPSKVRRPANSALATGKLADRRGRPLRRWEEALQAYLVLKGHRR